MSKRKMWLMIVLILLTGNIIQAGPTKSENNEDMGWTLLTDTADAAGIKTTGPIDVSGSYDTVLHIDVCGAEAAAHDGTQVIVQIASEADANSWTYLHQYISPAVTFVKVDINGVNTGAVLDVNGIDAANFDHQGKHIVCYDTGTIGNSTILYQISSDDGADTITCLAAPDHAQDTDCDLLTVDGDESNGNTSAVSTMAVPLPLATSQYRIIFNNWYGLGTDANVIVRVRRTEASVL